MSKKTETVKLIVASIVNVFTTILLANKGETVKQFKKNLKKTINAEETIKLLSKEVKVHLQKEKLVDPDAPKKGKNSYMFFCKDKRAEVKEETGLKGKELARALGTAWKALSEKKKAKYKRMADIEKLAREAEKAVYVKKSEDELRALAVNQKKTKKKKYKDIKNPRTAYTFYCKDKRPEMKVKKPNLKGPEMTSYLAKKWKALSEEKKGKYKRMAEEDVKRYEEEVEQYEAKQVQPAEVVEEEDSDEEEDEEEEEEEPQKIEKPKKKKEKIEKTKQKEEEEDIYSSDIEAQEEAEVEEQVVESPRKKTKKTKKVIVSFE